MLILPSQIYFSPPFSYELKTIRNYPNKYFSLVSDFNKGGAPIWYYNTQTLKPEVQEKFKEMEIVPFDNPP